MKEDIAAGVHASHCCLRHYCKYGYKNCPVTNGRVAQKYRCEYCDYGYEEAGAPRCSANSCDKPGYWKWEASVVGGGILMVQKVQVYFYLCDGHDEWHRFKPEWKFAGKPVEERVQ